MEDIIQSKQIAEGIILIKKQNNFKKDTYIFQVQVKRLNIVEFQCDFTGSQNITVKDTNVLKTNKTIQPYQKIVVAFLQLNPGWKLKSKFRFTLKSPSKERQLEWIQAQNKILKSYILNSQTIFKNYDIPVLSIQSINSILEKSKSTYLDLDFIPQQFSIMGKQDRTLLDDTVTQWRRPDKFLKPGYQIIERIHPSRLILGKLGNQTLYSVLRCLCIRPPLVERLFYNINQINDYGVYRLKLCKNGIWQNITIDDFIPCQPTSHPKFLRSSQNQLWPVLIQKAYAKLQKSYFSLRQLEIKDIFLDLTGCPTQVYNLGQQNKIKNKLMQYDQKNHLISFYTIQNKRQYEEDEFSPVIKRSYAVTRINPKTFQISLYTQTGQKQFQFAEIKQKFMSMIICEVRNWEQIRLKGRFIKVQNPTVKQQYNIISRWYYTFSIQALSQINITLHQEDLLVGCNRDFKPYLWVSLVLLQKANDGRLKPLMLQPFQNKRQFNIRTKLDIGNYILVPVCISNLQPTNKMNEQQLVQDIFNKLDLLMNKQLKFNQLVPFFKAVKYPFNQQQFINIVKKYSKTKAIGITGFKKLWANYRQRWVQQIQQFSQSRQFVISVHSNRQISLLVKDSIGTDLDNTAHVQIIKNLGQSKDYDKMVKIYYLKNQNKSVSYMAYNESIGKLEVQLDCSTSTGYNFRPTNGKVSRKLDSDQYGYIMQLMPQLRGDLNFSINQVVNIKMLD